MTDETEEPIPEPDRDETASTPDESGASTSESLDKTAATILGGSMVAVGLAIAVVAADAIVDSLDSFGAVDRRVEAGRFFATLGGAVLAGLGANTVLKAWKPQWKWWSQLMLALGVVAALVATTTWFFVERPDSEVVEGELTADNPFEERVLISGGNGYRYFITLERSGDLQAGLTVRGTGTPIPGVVQDDGRIVAEGVLLGDTTWTVLLSYFGGAGKYRIFVDSSGPETLDMDTQPLSRAFDRGRSRVGYVFSLDRPTSVYLKVDSRDDQLPTPALLLRDSDGTPIDNVPAGGDGTIFTRMERGDYVLVVAGSQNQRFELTYNDTDPTTGSVAPPDPEPVDASVPNVYGEPEQAAVAALSEAGFVVQAVPVCSNSMAAEGAEVGTTRQVVLSGAASVSDEVEVVGEDGVQIRELETGSALDIKVYNGLPCDLPRLGPDEKLYVGDRLSIGNYVVEMTADRGLVGSTLDTGSVWYESDPERPPTTDGVLIMQASDGNLVIYDFDPEPESIVPPDRVAWVSDTSGNPDAYLSLSIEGSDAVLDLIDADGELIIRLARSG